VQLQKFTIWIFPLCLGLLVASVSLTLTIATRADTLHNLSALLGGEYFRFAERFYPIEAFYNRVMFPLIHQGLSHLLPALSEERWYVMLRIVSFQLAFVVFTLACIRALKPGYRDYYLAATLLALSFIISFNWPWENPSDALDAVALSAGALASLSGRFFLALGLALIFAANRESAAFIGIIWIVLADRSTWLKPRRLFEGLFIAALSYAVAIGLRYYIAGPNSIKNYFAADDNARKLLSTLVHIDPLSWLALLLSLFAIMLISINYSNALARRFVALAAILAVPTFLYGLINEIRVFLPSLLMLAFAVAANKDHAPDPVSPIRASNVSKYDIVEREGLPSRGRMTAPNSGRATGSSAGRGAGRGRNDL
jgi:hypothetical protein